MSENMMAEGHPGTYHSDRCQGCGALLPADDWSRRFCDVCGQVSHGPAETVDGTPDNWDVFWGEVARLHRTYGTLEDA